MIVAKKILNGHQLSAKLVLLPKQALIEGSSC